MNDSVRLREDLKTMMKVLLKTLVLLVCAEMGLGNWIQTLIDQRRIAASSVSGAVAAGGSQSRASVPGSPLLRRPPVLRSRRSTPDPHCSLRSVLIKIRDLGLGYDSDEEVLFKFCSGACPHHRSNHDLALNNLLQSGVLPTGGTLGDVSWHYAPCCRPTHHEDMAFLDNNHRWHKVEKLSAADCACVG